MSHLASDRSWLSLPSDRVCLFINFVYVLGRNDSWWPFQYKCFHCTDSRWGLCQVRKICTSYFCSRLARTLTFWRIEKGQVSESLSLKELEKNYCKLGKMLVTVFPFLKKYILVRQSQSQCREVERKWNILMNGSTSN